MQSNDANLLTHSEGGDRRNLLSLQEYVFKNPFLVLWNCALILGGLITFGHFSSIKYFPDLDIKTASSFLLGIALLGLLLTTLLALTLIAPSYLLRNEIWINYFLHEPRNLGQATLRVSADLEKRRRLPFLTLNLCYGLAAFFAFVFLSSHLIDRSYAEYRENVRLVGGIGLVLSLAAQLYGNRYWKQRDRRDNTLSNGWRGHSHVAQHVTLAFIWMIVSPGYLLLLTLAVGKLKESDLTGHFCILLFVVIFIVVNSGLSITNFNSARSLLIVPAMAAVLTLGYLSLPSNPLSITHTIFASFAIGDLGSSRFVVKRATCDAVNLIAAGTCEIASESAGCIRPKSLANRIGSEYLLVLESRLESGAAGDVRTIQRAPTTEIRVPIPKSEVLVWGSVDATDKRWASCKAAASVNNESERRAASGSRGGQH
jgi:hypothetical protein